MAFVAHKYHLDLESLNDDLREFAEVEKDKLFQNSLTAHDEYKTFIDNNEAKLQELYDKENKFTTSTRGIKVRGSFPTQEEAEIRAKTLRTTDTAHDIMVGPVGMWLPFDPDAYKTGRTEYLEAELNQLMHEKKKNEEKANAEFTRRVKDAKEKALKDNMEKAKQSGNKLTQTLDASGNLVSVSDVTTFGGDLKEGEDVSAEDVRDKLFHDPNVLPAPKTVVDIGGGEADVESEGPQEEEKEAEKQEVSQDEEPQNEESESSKSGDSSE